VRVYVDSSALIKRGLEEQESDALDEALERHVAANDVLVASSLAWVEVTRAILATADADIDVSEIIETAVSGIAERFMTEDVVSLARRIGPKALRSLDAIHLATAVILDADLIVTYDNRLAAAARHNGLAVAKPAINSE
jgi:predicted nucleic acid-binding protein